MGSSQGAIVLWLISLLAFIDLIGSNSLTHCTISKRFTSPYVEPLYQQTLVPTGCTSKSLMKSGREVHVISVLNNNQRVNIVKLNLLPLDKTEGLHETQLVVVLHSIHPVTWQVHTHNISNQTRRNIFWIPYGSRLENMTNIHIKRRKSRQMPENAQLLFDWVKQKYETVTSFSQVKEEVNSIVKHIGIDASLPETCTIQSNYRSPTIQMAMIRRTDLVQGCAVPNNVTIRGKEVHIIEVHSPSTDISRTQSDIIVNLLPNVADKDVRNKDIILVLVAQVGSIVWRVNSHNIHGKIEIVGNYLINTTGMKSMQVTVKDIHSQRKGASLVSWVRDNYGPPRSYTEIGLANRVNVRLDDIVPTHSDNNRTNRFNRRRSPFSHPDETRSALGKAVSVTCNLNGMTVTVARNIMQDYGVTEAHISLEDTNHCKAAMNSTHFILNTMLNTCNTRKRTMTSGVQYLNSVVISKLPQDDGMPTETGSATYQHDEGGSGDGMMSDDTRMDDEDLYETDDRISHQFHCDYSQRSPIRHDLPSFRPNPGNKKETQLTYDLNIYSDSMFSELKYVYPLKVHNGDRVYVEADLTGDERVRVTIHSCWLTRSQYGNDGRHKLIENGCRIDSTVQWHRDSMDELSSAVLVSRQRFSFQLSKIFPYVFLQCELTLCSHDGIYGAPDVQKCLPQRDYCTTQNQKTGTSQKPRLIFKGPLQITDTPTKNNYNPVKSYPGPSESGKNCKDRPKPRPVIIQGLDSGTVIGIAFAAFFIGVLLTAALWYIHTHTGPASQKKKCKMARRRGESSGDSTPSSSVPMAV